MRGDNFCWIEWILPGTIIQMPSPPECCPLLKIFKNKTSNAEFFSVFHLGNITSTAVVHMKSRGICEKYFIETENLTHKRKKECGWTLTWALFKTDIVCTRKFSDFFGADNESMFGRAQHGPLKVKRCQRWFSAVMRFSALRQSVLGITKPITHNDIKRYAEFYLFCFFK